jgi:hypothetical protein
MTSEQFGPMLRLKYGLLDGDGDETITSTKDIRLPKGVLKVRWNFQDILRNFLSPSGEAERIMVQGQSL